MAQRAVGARSHFGAVMLAVIVLATPAVAGILRNRAEVRDFRYENPCPATGLRRGACPGWQVDHITPLCAGGADKRENMQWISLDDHRLKTLVDVRECRRQRIRRAMQFDSGS